jgi:hypothetical protein
VRSSITGPNDLAHDPTLEEPIDLATIYEESTHEVDPEWLARFGEADWYAAITLFGLWHEGRRPPGGVPLARPEPPRGAPSRGRAVVTTPEERTGLWGQHAGGVCCGVCSARTST